MKKFRVFSLLAVGLMMLAQSAYDDCGGKMCQFSHGGKWGRSEEKNPCPIMSKFFHTSHEILEHKTELGLTEEQVKSVKDLKLDMEKRSIKQMADMQIFMLDIKSKLGEDKVDTDQVNAMIDQGFANMSATAKDSVASYAGLKGILTD